MREVKTLHTLLYEVHVSIWCWMQWILLLLLLLLLLLRSRHTGNGDLGSGLSCRNWVSPIIIIRLCPVYCMEQIGVLAFADDVEFAKDQCYSQGLSLATPTNKEKLETEFISGIKPSIMSGANFSNAFTEAFRLLANASGPRNIQRGIWFVYRSLCLVKIGLDYHWRKLFCFIAFCNIKIIPPCYQLPTCLSTLRLVHATDFSKLMSFKVDSKSLSGMFVSLYRPPPFTTDSLWSLQAACALTQYCCKGDQPFQLAMPNK